MLAARVSDRNAAGGRDGRNKILVSAAQAAEEPRSNAGSIHEGMDRGAVGPPGHKNDPREPVEQTVTTATDDEQNHRTSNCQTRKQPLPKRSVKNPYSASLDTTNSFREGLPWMDVRN